MPLSFYLDGSPDGEQVKDDLPHGEVELLLRDELDDLDEDVQRSVSRHDRLRALREERVDDALKSEKKSGDISSISLYWYLEFERLVDFTNNW